MTSTIFFFVLVFISAGSVQGQGRNRLSRNNASPRATGGIAMFSYKQGQNAFAGQGNQIYPPGRRWPNRRPLNPLPPRAAKQPAAARNPPPPTQWVPFQPRPPTPARRPPPPNRCPYSPVCGSDRNTYSSVCYLPPSVFKQCAGPCPCPPPPTTQPPTTPPPPPAPTTTVSPWFLPMTILPLFGCNCPTTYNPVCGMDGQQYDNDCWLKCEGVSKNCNGPCPCDNGYEPEPKTVNSCDLCWFDYDPVCGGDGQTYINHCHARCSDAEVQCSSECPC